MSMPKMGSRPILVDGLKYRWRIRRLPTYCQGCEWRDMTVAVELFSTPGAVLVIDTKRLRLDSWMSAPSGGGVTPRDIAAYIRDAIASGWRPADPGGAFQLSIDQPQVL